jgi:hypothetical protein
MTTPTRRPLKPPPEPSRPAPLNVAGLVEIERRNLQHGLAAIFYGHPPGPDGGDHDAR